MIPPRDVGPYPAAGAGALHAGSLKERCCSGGIFDAKGKGLNGQGAAVGTLPPLPHL